MAIAATLGILTLQPMSKGGLAKPIAATLRLIKYVAVDRGCGNH